MRSLTYRRLREAELIHWLTKRYGSCWINPFSRESGIPAGELRRWKYRDHCGRINDQIEAWAERQGFISRYAVALECFRGHEFVLSDVVGRGKKKTLGPNFDPRAGLPLLQKELEQLFAGLGF